MSGKRSRDKGKVGEREACKALEAVWPGLVRQYGQARMNSATPDIDAPGCPVHIEVKRTESASVYVAMAQALQANTGPRPTVVVHRRNRGAWLVTMHVDDLRAVVAGTACVYVDTQA